MIVIGTVAVTVIVTTTRGRETRGVEAHHGPHIVNLCDLVRRAVDNLTLLIGGAVDLLRCPLERQTREGGREGGRGREVRWDMKSE